MFRILQGNKYVMMANWFIAMMFFKTNALAMPVPQSSSGDCLLLSTYVRLFKRVIGESVYISVIVNGKEKHLRIIKDNWSHDYRVVARVSNKSEADQIYRLLEVNGYDSLEKYTPSTSIDESTPLPYMEGDLEMQAPVKTSNNLNEFINALSGRLVEPDELIPKVVDTVESMRQWVFWKYFEYKSIRSAEDTQLLWSFRTAGYKGIQDGLRQEPGLIPLHLQNSIEIIDRQFIKNSIDLPLTFFHVSANPELEKLWDRIQNGENISELPVDSAYTFTNLSKDFAVYWKKQAFKGKGIILQIQASKDSKAIPMDKLKGERGILNQVSELEFVLPRNSRFVPTAVGVDSDGNKIIYCNYN